MSDNMNITGTIDADFALAADAWDDKPPASETKRTKLQMESQERFDNRHKKPELKDDAKPTQPDGKVPFVRQGAPATVKQWKGKTFEKHFFVKKPPSTRFDVAKLWVAGDPERTNIEYLNAQGKGSKPPHDTPNGKPGIIHFKCKPAESVAENFAALKDLARKIMIDGESFQCGNLPSTPNTIHCPHGFKCFKLWNRVACDVRVSETDRKPCHHTIAEYLVRELTLTLLEHIDAKPAAIELKKDIDSMLVNFELAEDFGIMETPKEVFKWSSNYTISGIFHSDRKFEEVPKELQAKCIEHCKEKDKTLPAQLSKQMLNFILGCGGLSRIQSTELSTGTPLCGHGGNDTHDAVCLPSLMAGKPACPLRHTNAQEILTQILMMVIRFKIVPVAIVPKSVAKSAYKTTHGKKHQLYDRKNKKHHDKVKHGVATVAPPPPTKATVVLAAEAKTTTSNGFEALANL